MSELQRHPVASVIRRSIRGAAGLLWGASTSPHQTEGNNTGSDWWWIENQPGSPLAEKSGVACDSYRLWEQDMDLLVAAGLNAYRFGVEWARIQPALDVVDQDQIRHYTDMVEGARRRGLTPVVTLHHFTLPAWFAADGGWLRPDAVTLFSRYVAALEPVLQQAGAVVTINEPNMVAIMHRVFAGEVSLEQGLGGGLPLPSVEVTQVLIQAHHAARTILKEQYPDLPVGWSVASQVVRSVPGGEEYARTYRDSIEDVFIRAAAEDDFLGVQAYTRTVFAADGSTTVPLDAPRTQTGWEYFPEAIGEAVKDVAAVAPGLPVLVTENGIATADDTQRIEYTQGALVSLQEATATGITFLGYLHWSLLDNYEWGSWKPTFGLVEVDRDGDFGRTAKPSLSWLGEQARTRTLTGGAPQISVPTATPAGTAEEENR